MVFTDSLFLFYFLPAALLIHRVSLGRPSPRTSGGVRYPDLSRLTLFALTLVFYGLREPWWLFPFLVAVVFDFIWARLIHLESRPGRRKLWLGMSLCQNLTLLSLFKYRDAVLALAGEAFPMLRSSLPQLRLGNDPLPLPPGISFYLFESMSFVIDVYRQQVTPPRHPFEFFAFIGMFPRFVAGPIVRYREMVGQFADYRGMEVERGLFVFLVGFTLKACLADNLGVFTYFAYDRRETIEFLSAWAGGFAYALQIYFDFLGYSLMAEGLGRCLGFRFPRNFDRPYHAATLQEFWRRWHMTLSRWFRDYVYIPLGGSRHGVARTYFNLMMTMFLCGVWHGTTGNCLLFGLWHGGWQCLERAWRSRFSSPWPRAGTFLVILMGMAILRARDLQEALRVLEAMMDPIHRPWLGNFESLRVKPISLAFAGAGYLLAFWGERHRSLADWMEVSFLSLRWRVAALGAFGVSLLVVFSSRTIPFLYFQF